MSHTTTALTFIRLVVLGVVLAGDGLVGGRTKAEHEVSKPAAVNPSHCARPDDGLPR